VIADLMDSGYTANNACCMGLGENLGESFLAGLGSLYRSKTKRGQAEGGERSQGEGQGEEKSE